MKQNNIAKEKKIRRLLLLNSDKEMQNKIKKKNPVLINSMTPLELENSFQLYKDIINTSVSTYTNILEKHIVKCVVDIHNNINYYYSDSMENKKRRKINKNNKYKRVYSHKIFDSNFGDFIDDEEESEEKEENEKEEIIKSIIPFIKKKKSVWEGKIIKDKSYSIISPKISDKNKDDINNNICFDTCDLNSKSHQQCQKKKKRKMLDINYKLIYYCYTYLKRKRPLLVQNNDNNISICGLEIEEEYFNQIKSRASTVKKNKIKNKFQLNKLRSKSTKNISRKKVKKNKYLKELKDINKKNLRGCITNRNKSNNNHSNNLANELSNLKSKIHKYISIRSDKKYKIGKKRLSQDNKIEKCRTISIVKKHNKILSNDNKKINIRESPFQNIISKLDTKTTSFDDNSSSMEFKNRWISNKKRWKESKLNSKNKDKDKTKNIKRVGRRKFKFITHNKLKHQCLEEIKDGNNKPNKKSLKEPIRAQFMNSLQKKVGFNFEENKKNFYKNKKASSKVSLINKIKSKSKKDCIVDDDNSDDDDNEQYFKKKMYSYGLKENKINSIHSKRKYNK